MTWLYTMSHPIMTPGTSRRPHKPSNQEIMEARDDHTQDVSITCQPIMDMEKLGIEACLFEEVNPQLALVEGIIAEA